MKTIKVEFKGYYRDAKKGVIQSRFWIFSCIGDDTLGIATRSFFT